MAFQVIDGFRVELRRGDLGAGDYSVSDPATGRAIGRVRDRYEIYSGIRSGNGRGGGTFRMWDAFGADGRRVVRTTYHCSQCGGVTHGEVGEHTRGYQLQTCQSCGHVHSGDDHARSQEGPAFTTERGRNARLSASTRKAAVGALVKAWQRETGGAS